MSDDDSDGEDPKPCEPEKEKPKRSLSDYKVTMAPFVPHVPGTEWEALPWPMWERAEECLVQFERHLASPTTGPKPDLQILVAGNHAWGPIAEVTIEYDIRDNTPLLGVRLRDHRLGFLYNSRLVDPCCGLLALILELPGGSIDFNSNGGDRTHLYYGAYNRKTPLRRIFANTLPGWEEHDPIRNEAHPYGHYSYRLCDRGEPRKVLPGDPKTKHPYRGRFFAFDTALMCFEKRAKAVHVKISAEAYYEMLMRCARIIDLLYGRGSEEALDAA